MEAEWANVFHDTIIGSDWYKPCAISPGRGAVGYNALYVIYRVLNELRPQCILECGSGESTKLFLQYAEFFGANLDVVEHSPFWLNLFLTNNPLGKKYCTAVKETYTSVMACAPKSRSYDWQEFLKKKGRRYEFVFVDGPNGSPSYSRPQVLDLIPHLADNFAIVMDDYERPGEQETIAELGRRLLESGRDYVETVYYSKKQVILLRSPSLGILASI
ncbi:MAG: hypothetical protein LBP65_01995 [Puniceicoccales bacterium]|jgi:hypothetical protein|nr:hypothetical protein [Puniceicoccales bacterium]